jgi:Bacteriocin-protection, YdeI or OmpD-Associated
MRAMRVQQFRSHVIADATGRPVITIPFDPDETWGAKAFHPVGGTIQTVDGVSCGRRLRGRLTSDGSQWVFTVNPMWMRDTGVAVGDEVIVELEPEGPQRGDLAPDIAAALEASPEAAAFFDTLAQFYRMGYLRWIDATTRRPDVRAARIAEVVALLAAGIKERPRQ